MNKIAITTGYMGSGSSAITDLLSEFDDYNVNNRDFEYVMLHCPDGLFDLEDKLLNGNNALRSDEAICRFEKCMKILYDTKNFWPGMYKKRVSVKFEDITEKFVETLLDFKFDNNIYWYFQQVPDNVILQMVNYLKRLLKVLPIHNTSNRPTLKYKGMKISYPTPEEFYKSAKKYLNDFYSLLGYAEHNLLLDQFLLPHNLFRINNYFDENVRIFVVDRDPRDVFVLNKYVWLKKGCPIAYPIDVKDFCKYYKKMRHSERLLDDRRVLRIHFEDLIYNYENSVVKICNFLDLKKEGHTRKKEKFDPQKSINNTQVFRNFYNCGDEIFLIEKELSNYIYAFPYDLSNDSMSAF